MPKNKKPEFKADFCASCSTTADTFATVYASMLESPQFQSLSLSGKYTYLLCRAQLTSRQGRSCLYNHAKETGVTYPTNCFVFPAKHAELYGVHRQNLGRNLSELIDRGFIRKYEDNKSQWKVNVYQFSDKWKDYSA